jgi:hypothetical protein
MRAPTLTQIKEWLSKPWIGPSISLVVLVVGITSLAVNVASYYRQGARWQAEEDNLYQVQLQLENHLTKDGYRWGYISFYTRGEPARLQKVEIVNPAGSTISWSKEGPPLLKAEIPAASSFELPRLQGLAENGHGGIPILIRTPETPLNDQGLVVEIQGTMFQLIGENRVVVRTGRTTISRSAVKSPDM